MKTPLTGEEFTTKRLHALTIRVGSRYSGTRCAFSVRRPEFSHSLVMRPDAMTRAIPEM